MTRGFAWTTGNKLDALGRDAIVQYHPQYRTVPRRYASKSSQPRQQPTSQARRKSSSTTTALSADVNPPASTRPDELDLPAAVDPTAPLKDKLNRYIALGKAYLTFYKTGMKNVYLNYRASIPLRRSLGLPIYLPSSPPPRATAAGGKPFQTVVDSLNLSRADFQLVRRAAYDVRRTIPFALVLLICAEFTPLTVLALGDAVTPYTCRVPQQIDKTRLKRAQLKRDAFAAVQTRLRLPSIIKPGSEEELSWLAEKFGSKDFVETASAEEVLLGCAVFGLTKSIFRPAFLVPWVYRPRLRHWVEYLALDDQLIVRGGGVDALTPEEVRIAVDERGGVGVGVGHAPDAVEKERKWLEQWLQRRNVAG